MYNAPNESEVQCWGSCQHLGGLGASQPGFYRIAHADTSDSDKQQKALMLIASLSTFLYKGYISTLSPPRQVLSFCTDRQWPVIIASSCVTGVLRGNFPAHRDTILDTERRSHF
jgi:hypothetical protein